MERSSGYAVIGASLAMVLAGGTAGAASSERPAIVLHVQNSAGVAERDLQRARAEVDAVFEDAGVAVRWVDSAAGAVASEPPDRPARHVSVLLLRITADARAGAEGCALGLAVASRSTAYVFVNRLLAATRNRPLDVAVVLGRAIAHEVGHVLLPAGRHARYGLMRAELDFGLSNPPRFTRDEARALQALDGARAAR